LFTLKLFSIPKNIRSLYHLWQECIINIFIILKKYIFEKYNLRYTDKYGPKWVLIAASSFLLIGHFILMMGTYFNTYPAMIIGL